MRVKDRRLPIEPVLRFSGLSKLAFARLAGVHPRQLYRWLDYGAPLFDADRIAAALNLNPYEVWGPEFGEEVTPHQPSRPL